MNLKEYLFKIKKPLKTFSIITAACVCVYIIKIH